MKKMKFCTIPAWTKRSFLHRNSKLVILTKHFKLCIDHWKYGEAMIWSLNRNSRFVVKSKKSTLRTHSWEGLERIEGGVTLGSNKISKQSPQSMLQGVHMDRSVKIPLFVPVIFCSRFVSRASLSTSLLALKFKSALPLVLASQGCTPHAGLPAGL